MALSELNQYNFTISINNFINDPNAQYTPLLYRGNLDMNTEYYEVSMTINS